MKSLKERWLQADGKLLLDAVLKWLSSGSDIASVGLSKHQDRWDLRGVALPKGLVVRNSSIRRADFSYAVMNGTRWEQCRFEDLVFLKTNAEQSGFWSCEFDDVSFVDARLVNTLMNGALDTVYAGYFKRVKFVNTNLQATIYTHALFEHSEFVNCKLNKVDFNGARFVDSKFSGKLVGVFFRGYPTTNKALYPNYKPVQNRMERVDFREAHMESVNFLDGIVLGSCLFPKSDDYILVAKNRIQIFTEARQIIERSWDEAGKRLGLMLIDQYFLSPRKAEQDVEFLDRHYLTSEPGKQLFELIRVLNDKWNNAV